MSQQQAQSNARPSSQPAAESAIVVFTKETQYISQERSGTTGKQIIRAGAEVVGEVPNKFADAIIEGQRARIVLQSIATLIDQRSPIAPLDESTLYTVNLRGNEINAIRAALVEPRGDQPLPDPLGLGEIMGSPAGLLAADRIAKEITLLNALVELLRNEYWGVERVTEAHGPDTILIRDGAKLGKLVFLCGTVNGTWDIDVFASETVYQNGEDPEIMLQTGIPADTEDVNGLADSIIGLLIGYTGIGGAL